MSLQSDLARNRKVFERLIADAPDYQENLPFWEERAEIPARDEPSAQKPLRTITTGENKPGPVRAFSLSYGSRELPSSFEPPGEISHPELSGVKTTAFADPLESLYYQLEVDARRVSQLSGEEDWVE